MVDGVPPLEGFTQAESGLIVPDGLMGSSLDLVRSYCSYKRLLGEEVSRAEVEQLIRAFSRLNLVTPLAKLTCHLEQSDEADEAIQRGVAHAFTPDAALDSALERIAEGDVFTSRQVALALCKLVFARASDELRDVDPRDAGTLLLGLADHLYDSDPQGATHDATLSRLGLFSRSTSPGQAWGRYELLWRDIAVDLDSHPDAFELAPLVRDAFGLEWRLHEALSSICYLHFWSRVRNQAAEWYERIPLTGTMITDEEQAMFFDRWSADEAWFAAQPIEPLALEFSAFRRRPLLRNRQEGIAPMSLRFLLFKGSDGFLEGLADHLYAQDPDLSHQIRTWFGAIWERYVLRILEDAVGDADRTLSEAQLKALPHRGPVCDAVVRYPSAWLLVEAHGRRITYEGAVHGTAEALERDLRDAIVGEAKQLAGTVEALKANLAGDGDAFLPVVVVPWPFPVMPTTMRYVGGLVGDDPECGPLKQPGVGPVVVMDGQDWETLIATSLKLRRALHDLVRDWQASGYSETNFENWAKGELRVGAIVPPSLERARTRFHERSLETAFRRT